MNILKTLLNFERRLASTEFGFIFAAVLAFNSSSVMAWIPGSGDVDLDGKTTVQDAAMIYEWPTWPESTRNHLQGWRDACDIDRNGICNDLDAERILLSTITDWKDYDSDGVPNDQDCAVFDDKIATPHSYYIDLDGDYQGSDQRVLACTTKPAAPLVMWNGDPNDYSQVEQTLPIAKETRILAVDMTDLPESGAWRPDLAKELGIDAVPLKIDWQLVETNPGIYNGPQVQALAIAASEYNKLGLQMALSVNPISQGFLTLPADLRSDVETGRLRFNDKRVIERYQKLLTFIHNAIPGVPLVSLQLGYEVDRFLSQSNVPVYFWSDYGELILAAAKHAKSLWGSGIKIGVTSTNAGLLNDATKAQMAAINSLVDMVSATYAPAYQGDGGTDPMEVKPELQKLIALAYPKQLYLQSVEYPAYPAAGGSEVRQSQFIRAVFDIWDQYRALIPYVSFGRLFDRSAAIAADASSRNIGAPILDSKSLASVGLRGWTGDGQPKIAYNTLRNQAFERGWWRMDTPKRRSFEMGFTPSLFDAPTSQQEYVAMLDSIYETIRIDGTFMNLHLDNGVPWVEAAKDDFSKTQLPYSPYFQTSWKSHKDRIPPGHKVLVSVNPTGVPRNVIAPYFGIGEGFTYNDKSERVGDGIIADYENRMPPVPWNKYAFDHPEVMRAFTNYCRRAIQYFSPDYLVMAIETTATMHEDPDAYSKLVTLIKHVQAELKALPETKDVKLLVSLSATSYMVDEYGIPLKREEMEPQKRELQIQGLLDIAPYVDGFALSFYPHYSKWNASHMLASMYDELWKVLGQIGKPIGFSESGWPAESFDVFGSPFYSDPNKQARFLKHLIIETENAPVPVWFLTNFRTLDGDRQWQRLLDWSLQQPPLVSPQFVEFYKYFRDIGLFDGDGNQRPATEVWRQHLNQPYMPQP